MRRPGSPEKRLAHVRQQLAEMRERIRVLDEQVAFQRSVAADASVRAVVAETPLAERERHEAARDLLRLERQRDELADGAAQLSGEQDALLDRMIR
ncbi:MAG TPA: hypothetical protein VML96_13905 [Egibacteraceae bacterium]|nr:hypothetical protein [Egibacteraceae bacterium]